MKKYILLLLIVYLPKLTNAQYCAKILQLDSSKYLIQVFKFSQCKDSLIISKRLPYKIFKFKQADIDNDGQDEFITGVIKKTELDSNFRKRINIWKIENNNLVPLWLGSKMPQPLYDFEVRKLQNKYKVITIEYEFDGLFLVAEYEWHSFGLKFIRYLKRRISLNDAVLLISNFYE